MEQKKYQVFISSTYTDLIEERKKVQEVLLMADCIPAGMEAFVAANDEQFKVIKKVIDLCDYYVLIIGQRYGSINQTTGLSYTEMEYDYAVSQGIPVLVFAIDESIKLQLDKTETDTKIKKKLKSFRAKAMTNRLVSIWKNISDLTGAVAVSVMRAQNTIERPGWVRGGKSLEKDLNKIVALYEDNSRLVEENKRLKLLIKSTEVKEDLEAFSKPLTVEYSKKFLTNRGGETLWFKKNTSIKEIFQIISPSLENSTREEVLHDLIAQAVGAANRTYLKDIRFTDGVIKRLLDSKLIYENINRNGVIYELTLKGVKYSGELSKNGA